MKHLLNLSVNRCLFTGGISVFDGADEVWLKPLLAETCDYLHLHGWTETRDTLTSFPWVTSFHDKPGKALWEISRRKSVGVVAVPMMDL
jgi:hypothetical protein